jgi:hypothetical protein
LKQAAANLESATASYKKAVQTANLGNAERNRLLKTAYAGFEKTMNALEKVLGDKEDPKFEAVMERASMLMYGCLKYQSL